MLENRRSQPHADLLRFRIVVAEQLRTPTALTDPDRTCREHPDGWGADVVEVGGFLEEFRTGESNSLPFLPGHCGFDHFGRRREPIIQRQVDTVKLVAPAKLLEECRLGWRAVGEQTLLEQKYEMHEAIKIDRALDARQLRRADRLSHVPLRVLGHMDEQADDSRR